MSSKIFPSTLFYWNLINSAIPKTLKKPRTWVYISVASGLFGLSLSKESSFRDSYEFNFSLLSNYRFDRLHRQRKQLLLNSMRGDLTELNAGIGPNLNAVPIHNLSEYTAVESNADSLKYLANNSAPEVGLPATMIQLFNVKSSQYLAQLPNNSQDNVLASFYLSKQKDSNIEYSLQEIARVLKPGGRLYFIDYQRQDDSLFYRSLQALFNPIFKLFSVGNNLNNEIAASIFNCQEFDSSANYVESWPNYLNQNSSRIGIQRVLPVLKNQENANTGTIPNDRIEQVVRSVTGLSGIKPIIAGVLVKHAAPTKITNLSSTPLQLSGFM